MTMHCIDEIGKLFGKSIKFIIVTPATLVENFTNEMKWYGLNYKNKKYTFYTKEMFGLEYQSGNIDCKNSFIVIDEAHEFRTDYRQEFSGSPISKYVLMKKREAGKIQRAESAVLCSQLAWKVLLLTGTPMYNREYDIVNLVAMVKGQEPIDNFQWEQIMANDKYLNDYFKCTILYHRPGKADYPDRTDKLVGIEMTPEYYKLYHEEEIKIKNSNIKFAKTNDIDEAKTNAFMVTLRKAVNNLQGSTKKQEKISSCLKCGFVLSLIKEGQKTLIHSSLVTSGIQLLEEALDKEGIPYLEISGRISKKKRAQIAQKYIESDDINVLFVTSAGEMGLDLKGVRKVILLEKGWNVQREEQVIGRAVRYRSHVMLPEDERNVTVYHLILVKPAWVRKKVNKKPEFAKPEKRNSSQYRLEVESADEYLFKYSRSKQKVINEVDKRARKADIAHIEC
jgi:hypothetical protein